MSSTECVRVVQPPAVSPAAKGFPDLPCPRCGEAGAIRLLLEDLTTFTCAACDAEFTAEEVRALVTAWLPVLAWIDLAPPPEAS
jgi:uncharacterized protein (DUF983 family)